MEPSPIAQSAVAATKRLCMSKVLEARNRLKSSLKGDLAFKFNVSWTLDEELDRQASGRLVHQLRSKDSRFDTRNFQSVFIPQEGLVQKCTKLLEKLETMTRVEDQVVSIMD